MQIRSILDDIRSSVSSKLDLLRDLMNSADWVARDEVDYWLDDIMSRSDAMIGRLETLVDGGSHVSDFVKSQIREDIQEIYHSVSKFCESVARNCQDDTVTISILTIYPASLYSIPRKAEEILSIHDSC